MSGRVCSAVTPQGHLQYGGLDIVYRARMLVSLMNHFGSPISMHLLAEFPGTLRTVMLLKYIATLLPRTEIVPSLLIHRALIDHCLSLYTYILCANSAQMTRWDQPEPCLTAGGGVIVGSREIPLILRLVFLSAMAVRRYI